ncbi:hypothetical protein JTL78_37025, partial [Pseudomonas aeruginosa]|nr:hypothetical protein [Pseudomonas aeruginosa]
HRIASRRQHVFEAVVVAGFFDEGALQRVHSTNSRPSLRKLIPVSPFTNLFLRDDRQLANREAAKQAKVLVHTLSEAG